MGDPFIRLTPSFVARRPRPASFPPADSIRPRRNSACCELAIPGSPRRWNQPASPSRRAWSSPPAISPASSPRSHCAHVEEAANYAVRGLSNIYELTSTISIWCGANELAGDAHHRLPTNSRSVVTRGRNATGESESRSDSPRRDRAESGQAGDSQTAARVDHRRTGKRSGVTPSRIQHDD